MLNSALGKYARTIQVPMRFFYENNMKVNNLVGRRFTRLEVLERAGSDKKGNAKWLCKCECGNIITVLGNNLKRGTTQSCGCLHIERAKEANTIHGHYYERLYGVWRDIKDRCYNENNKEFFGYGGRGITVCDEWVKDFQAFYDWSMANGYKEGLTIDRINNDKGYSPDNCRWANMKTQSNNRRSNHLITYNGKTQTIAQWADEMEISYDALVARITKYHWTIERALTEPTKRR